MSNHTLGKNESHRVEFKRELTTDLDLEKEVVAFLNSPEGGLIFLGVDTAGNALDIKDIDIVSYFNKVSSYVYELTNKQQNPWFACSALTGEFRFSRTSFVDNNSNERNHHEPFSMSKTSKYDIFLLDCGPAKLLIAKVLIDRLGKTVPEAKRIVDKTPVLIASRIDRYSTEMLKDALEEYQAVVEIRESK